ncbi:MAG: hypothetical protein IPN59_16895 [Holophaga sp.]|nr:hypothetical protein [Holophaga sp.]
MKEVIKLLMAVASRGGAWCGSTRIGVGMALNTAARMACIPANPLLCQMWGRMKANARAEEIEKVFYLAQEWGFRPEHVRFLTLTVPNGGDIPTLREQLHEGWAKLQRRRWWPKWVFGWIPGQAESHYRQRRKLEPSHACGAATFGGIASAMSGFGTNGKPRLGKGLRWTSANCTLKSWSVPGEKVGSRLRRGTSRNTLAKPRLITCKMVLAALLTT